MSISKLKVDFAKIEAESSTIQIINSDNYDFVDSGSIDLILTDPPFNIARDTNFHTYEKNTINSYRFDKGKGWDSFSPQDFKAEMDKWAINFSRVLRPGGFFAIFCADEYLSFLHDSLKKAKLSPKRTITWRKPNAVPINREFMMMSACEYIVTGVKGNKSTFNATIVLKSGPTSIAESINIGDKVGQIIELAVRRAVQNHVHSLGDDYALNIQAVIKNAMDVALDDATNRATSIYKIDKEQKEIVQLCIPNEVSFNSAAGNRIHPTEKPVGLLKYLLEVYSRPGDLILDPFSGSGSLGEAAISMKRNAILVERDPEFYAKSIDRLNRTSL